MPYVSGTAANITALRDNIRTACTDNGWTLSGNVLHKGDCFIESTIDSGYIHWKGGTGKDGSNNLTGAAPTYVRTGSFNPNAMTFPVSYEVFIGSSPDEVTVVINYATDFYQFVMFGLSDVADLPGAGVYFAASRAANTGAVNSEFASGTSSSGFQIFNVQGLMPFFLAPNTSQTTGNNNSFIHYGLDSSTWSRAGAGSGVGDRYPLSLEYITPLIASLPNAWNNETVLLPFPVYIPRSSGNKVSLVADLKTVRHCRVDFLDPGTIVTLGSDEWKIYPWYRKDTTARNGNDIGTTHSGTFGFAVKYDGGS